MSEGTYNILKEVTPTEHKEILFIDFSNYPDVFVDGIDASNLYLNDHTADGYAYHYKKYKQRSEIDRFFLSKFSGLFSEMFLHRFQNLFVAHLLRRV